MSPARRPVSSVRTTLHSMAMGRRVLRAAAAANGIVVVVVVIGLAAIANGCSNASPSASSGVPDAGATRCAHEGDPRCAPLACISDGDCGDWQLFRCDPSSMKCVPACRTPDQCMRPHPGYGGAQWPGCEDGCLCLDRTCVPHPCTGSGICASGLVCKAGHCVEPDTGANRCEIAPDTRVMRVGDEVAFSVAAFKDDLALTVLPSAFTWASETPGLQVLWNQSGLRAVFEAMSDTQGVAIAAVRAQIGEAVVCHASVVIYPLEAPTGAARAILIDALNGRPVGGATIVLNASSFTEPPDAPGSYLLAHAPFGPQTISVFHPDYDYVTLVGISGRDLTIQLRRNPSAKRGGIAGGFTNLPLSVTAVGLGVAGLSNADVLGDIDFLAFAGEGERISVPSPSGGTTTVELPAGLVLSAQGSSVKSGYHALGEAGVCADAGRTADGSCAMRAGWALMGEVPTAALLPLLMEMQSGEPVGLGSLLTAADPYLGGFRSDVARDLEISLTEDTPTYTPHEFVPATPLVRKVQAYVPDLPIVDGVRLDTAFVIAGVDVPGRGFVPLGIAAGSDTNATHPVANGRVIDAAVAEDGAIHYSDDGVLSMSIAAPHGGIEDEGDDRAFMVAVPAAGALPSGAHAYAASSAFCYGDFVEAVGGFTDASGGDYGYRTGRFTDIPPVEGAAVRRAVFAMSSGRRWLVYFNADEPVPFDVPKPPAGFEDRTMDDGAARDSDRAAQSARAALSIQAFVTGAMVAGEPDPDINAVFNPLLGYDGWSVVYAVSSWESTPRLRFSAPSDCASGCSVKPDAGFKVKVTGVRDPSTVRVEFRAAGQSAAAAIEPVASDWTATHTFAPPLAAGQSVAIEVRLLETDGVTPLDPVVKAGIAVEIVSL